MKQNDLLSFVLECLQYIKKYNSLIKIIRVKGLSPRHWRQINHELGIQIDPHNNSLLRLIGMRLYLDGPMKIIRAISDVAQKEYAIQMQTELLDAELKAIEFSF